MNLIARSLKGGCFCCLLLMSGCNYNAIEGGTKPITASDLKVKHVYKVPVTKDAAAHLNRFSDPQLQRLVDVSLVDSPDLRAARARLVQAQQIAQGAYSALWPSAGLKGSSNNQHFSFQGTVPSPFNEVKLNKLLNGNLGLNFNYELDFWGKNRETVASRLNETFAAQMDFEETRLILSATVATAYFELQNNILQQQLAKENVRLLNELQGIVVDRAKQGIESDIPLKTAISNTQSAILSIEEYKQAELQSRHQLAVLLGKNPLNTQIDTTKFSYSQKQLALPKVISVNILAQRPDIASARALVEAAAHRVNVAKAAFFPDINLSALLSVQSLYFSNVFNLRMQTEGARAAVDLPIFDAGARKANLGAKQAEFELSVNRYNQTILNALQEISNDLSAMRTLEREIRAQNSTLASTESNYKLFRARYGEGIIDYVQLIEIKQVLIEQKAKLYDLQTKHKLAFVSLLTALGGAI